MPKTGTLCEAQAARKNNEMKRVRPTQCEVRDLIEVCKLKKSPTKLG
jgi:hypothetical protein